MANNIDERIVEMQFDNRQFESGVKQTINSLDDLKHSLKLEDAARGFGELDKAAAKVSFNPIQNGIEVVTQKFTALEIVAITALQRITNQVLSAGENLVKSFTIAPITSGWDKYESKVSSVQKILNSSADNTMPKVEAALEKIGWFTDETSYQFDQMVSTLGSFGSAGIELSAATDAIIGIANAAAISGVNASDASHAMLGFQRAIGSGYMSLGIWNSYLKTAGLQSQVFIDQCIKVATQMGKLKASGDGLAKTMKGNVVTAASFAETLNEKWLDKDVLTETLKSFSVATNQLYEVHDKYELIGDAIKDMGGELDEFSLKAFKAGQETKTWGDTVEYVRGTVAQNWSKTWELIFGNYEEATEFFSTIVEELYELFVATGVERNKFLKEWRVQGRAPFIDGLINSLRIIVNVVGRVREIFKSLIPDSAVQMAVNLSERFRDLTIKVSEMLGIDKIAGKVVEAIDSVKEGTEGVADAAGKVLMTYEEIDKLAKAVIRGDYGNGATRVEKLGKAYKIVQNRVNELLGCTFKYKDAEAELGAVYDRNTQKVMELNEQYNTMAKNPIGITRTIDNLSSTFRGVVAVIEILANLFTALIRVSGRVTGLFGQLGEGILGVTGSLGDLLVKVRDFIVENDAFYRLFMTIADGLSTIFQPALEAFSSWMDSLANREFPPKGWITNIEDFIKDGTGLGKFLESIRTAASNVKGPFEKFYKTLETDIKSVTGMAEGTDILRMGLGLIVAGAGKAGSALASLGGNIYTGAKNTFKTVSELFKIASEWFTTFELPSLKTSFKSFLRGLVPETGLIGTIKTFNNTFRIYGDAIKDILTRMKEANPAFNSFSTTTTAIFNTLVATFKGIGKKIGDFYNNTIAPFFEPLVTAISGFVDRIKKIDFGALTRLAILGTSLFLLFNLARLAGGLRKLATSLSGVGDSISSFIKSIKLRMDVAVVLSIAATIAIIAGIIYLLAKVAKENPWGLLGAVIAVGMIMGALYAIMSLLMKYGGFGGARRALEGAGAMLALAGALAIVVGSLYFLSKVGWTEILDACGKLLLVFAELALMMFILSKIGIGKGALDIKSMGAFYVFVMALGRTVDMIEELSKHKFSEMLEGIETLFAISVILVLLAKGLSTMKFSTSFGMLALVGSLWIFVKLLENLAKADYPAIYFAIAALIPVFASLATLVIMANFAAENAKHMAMLIGSFALTLLIIAESIKMLGKLDPGELKRGLGAMALIVGGFTAVTLLLAGKKVDFTKDSAKSMAEFFKGMGIACLAIAVSLRILSGIDFWDMVTAVGGLSATIVAFGHACKLAAGFKGQVGAIVAMAGSILVIAVALTLLSFLDIKGLATAGAALGGVIAAFGFALGQLKTVGIASVFIQAVVMAAVIAVITEALYKLAEIKDWKALLAASGSLSAVILSVGAAVSLLKEINWGDALSDALIMGAVIFAVTISLYALLQLGASWDQMLAAAGSISMVMLTFAGVFKLLQSFSLTGGIAKLAADFSAGMAIVMGVIVAMAGVLGLLKEAGNSTNVHWIKEGFQAFIDICTWIGESLGGLVGGIVNGFNKSATKDIEEVGERLKNFTESIKEFATLFGSGSGKVTWGNVLESTGKFMSSMSNLGDASRKSVNFQTLSTQMKGLGNALSLFWTIVKDSGMNVEKVKDASSAIAELASIVPPTAIEGDANAWETAATGLESLGNALVSFGRVVSGDKALDIDTVNGAIDVIKKLGGAVSSINTEDFEGWGKLIGLDELYDTNFNGEVDGDEGLPGLTRMANALVNFQKAIMGDSHYALLDIPLLTSTFDAIGQLAEAAGKVPTVTSGFSWSTLSDSLVGSDDEAIGLAESLVVFSKSGQQILPTGLARGLSAITGLAEAANTLPALAPGVLQWLGGDATLSTAADVLAQLGPQLVTFSNDCKGIKQNCIDDVQAILNRLGSVVSVWDDVSFSSFGFELEQFGTYLKSFYDLVHSMLGDGTDTDPLAGINSVISSVAGMFTPETIEQLRTAGVSMATHITNGMATTADEEMSGSLATWVSKLTNLISGEASPNIPMFQTAGHDIVKHVCDAICDSVSKTKAQNSINSLCTGMVTAIRAFYSSFHSAGAYLGAGLIAGFATKHDDAVTSARTLGEDMNRAFQGATHQSSPSKLWKKYGQYLIEGLTIGIDSEADSAVDAVRGLAFALNGEFSGSAMTPTLTPVVDLTGASAQASRLNTMFDANRAAALSASMNINSQVTQMDDLVDMTAKILGSIQNGSDLYLDDSILAGRINRRLGVL